MRVLVANSHTAFTHGGAEELANHLVTNLNAVPGITARLFRMPYSWEPPERLIEELVVSQNYRIPDVDLLIPLKFPAFAMDCRRKSYWIIHQHRQVYDLWNADLGSLENSPRGVAVRADMIRHDTELFGQSDRLFSISTVTQERLKRFNGLDCEVLRPPLNHPDIYEAKDYAPFVFAGGRIDRMKRQHLLIEAMRYVRADVKLVVVGPCNDPAYLDRLRTLIRTHGLQDRVVLKAKFVSRRMIAWLNNHARCVAYVPIDEDSFGYVTMEAFDAAKPVLSCTDSGGVLDLVSDAESGAVTAPEPKQIARGIDRLCGSERTAQKLGKRAREKWRSFDVTWKTTIERLLS